MPRQLPHGCWAAPLCLGLALPVWAQDSSDVRFSASLAEQTDSNLFRLPDGANVPALTGQTSGSERLGTATLGLNMNLVQSLQNFELAASVVDYRYQNFSYLDFTAFNYAAAWRWGFTPRLSGNFTSDRKESLTSFADYQGYGVRNQSVEANTRLDALYEIDGPWHVLAGVTESRLSSAQAVNGGGNFSSEAIDAGVRYAFASGSSLTYSAKDTSGSYLNRPLALLAGGADERFHQIDHELRLHWLFSGKSSADFNLTHVSRRHANFAARDYSGFNAGAGLNWSVTGKTTVTANYGHDLAAYATNNTNNTRTDRLSVGALWEITAKTMLRLRHEWAHVDYLGTPGLLPPSQRRDITRDGTVSLSWQPRQQFTLTAALQKLARASSDPGWDYGSRLATLTAQFSY